MSSPHTNALAEIGRQPLDPLAGKPLYRDLDPKLLLEPLNASRETFDETAMAELIESIRTLGVIQPLVVEQEGGNFRIKAGHRRWIASTALELPNVPCMVYAPGTSPGAAIQHHENAIRESVNVAQEARYFGRLLEQNCNGDVDELCALLKETRQYVEGRLILLKGWQQTLDALGLDLISKGVADELNKIDEEAAMLMYLDAAVRGGASIRMVREWRVQWQQTRQFATTATPPEGTAADLHANPSPSTMVCFLCESEESPHDMELLFTHKTCRRLILDRFLASLRPQPATE